MNLMKVSPIFSKTASGIYYFTLNKLVVKYFSPLSGKMTTITPDIISLATSIAAYIAAPLLIPTKIPSF